MTKGGKNMNSNKWRLIVAAAAALTFADAAGAAPIAANHAAAAMSSILPTFVRGGHGGHVGGHGGARGGFHGGGVHGGGVHGGYRGGAVHGGYHGGYRGGHNTVVVGGRGAWGRGYRWAPGGAIAAGAAIGFIAAGSAAVYASTRPPAPGLCWYYTDPSRRSGFWDVCP
jgi:hypothetical protein